MNIVLVEPEIPQNTGNVARTCALTCSTLHLVRPLGFSLEDRYLKRAGLDYWEHVRLVEWESFGDLVQANVGGRFHLATTRTAATYEKVRYGSEDFLVFGRRRDSPLAYCRCSPGAISASPCWIWVAPLIWAIQ